MSDPRPAADAADGDVDARDPGDDEPLFSAHWHRVRDVRPRLASDVEVVRHVYRNRPSWLLRRRSTGAHHRLDADGFELVDRLDGAASVGDVWERALVERGRAAPSQDAWTALLADLHAAELLVVDRRVPVETLFERRAARRGLERRQRRLNPFFLRFALHDPNAWLTRLAPFSRRLFSRPAFAAWCALLGVALAALVGDGERLARALASPELVSPARAWLFVLLYPPLKLVHELAHALAVVRRGGAVHEVGIALLVLLPVPYVDASASAAFPDKRDRMLVGAAGILVELAFAAVGALLWTSASGALADAGLVLLLVGGVSTLLVNGNPLLRFDGYHVLADWLEIPNLASRSRRAALDALRALLTGVPVPGPRVEDARERAWLLGHGTLSALYRTALMLSIAWYVSGRWAVLGAALAAFAVGSAVLLPAWRAARALGSDPRFGGARARLLGAGVPAALVACALWLPLPHASVARGVVWLPDEAIVRAAGDCEVRDVAAVPGSDVAAGDPLFRCPDPELGPRVRELAAVVDELDARAAGLAPERPAEHARLAPELDAARAALADARERETRELAVATLDGRFDVPGTSALEGRALARGDVAGYVVPRAGRTVRVALEEARIAAVDEALERVEVRVPGATGEGASAHPSAVVRRVPRASYELASAALGDAGGGRHRSDPAGDGRRLLEPVFDLELAWPAAAAAAPVGSAVEVRFVHAPTPLGPRLADALRRAFDGRRA